MVGVSDLIGQVLWTRRFLEEQGHKVKSKTRIAKVKFCLRKVGRVRQAKEHVTWILGSNWNISPQMRW